ncbi:hypothetical protein KVR01_012999 [Diaporthe batatas]|uniref:uncharacterized protein n=1 Tax=Diaporthe batatas TaxID=748121 RepID=UPI001D0378F7|nr:uncharacterized protein KVR01_012999 [Diaporthe batatas]KAG8157291.1 hypothetical protein KVR01_012999 [Diaporthe batatas]
MMSSIAAEKRDLPIRAPVKDEEAGKANQMNNAMAFHRYMDLPFEIRRAIRARSIDQHQRMMVTDEEGNWQFKVDLARLATVSKEWRKDIEKILFANIRFDSSKVESLSFLEAAFTPRRKRFIQSLDIIINDEQTVKSPWHKRMGLLEISRVMERTGHLFQWINWDFRQEVEDRQSIEIRFRSSSSHTPNFEDAVPDDPSMQTSSLWMREILSRATNSGQVPTNIVLWAINFEFPSSLNMVTSLTFPPDCLPLPATLAFLRRMPNLKSCNFELAFKSTSEDAWGNFADLINALPALVPSLRDLNIKNPRIDKLKPETVMFNPKRLSTAIRDYSQSLKYLSDCDFTIHQSFFQPFSDDIGTNIATSQLWWPRLEILSLIFATFAPYASERPLGLTAAGLLVAAGRAATAMPVLRLFQADVSEALDGKQYKYLQVSQESPGSSGGSGGYSVQISGFSKEDDGTILNAWTSFLGVEARFVKEKEENELVDPQIRRFYTTCADGQD